MSAPYQVLVVFREMYLRLVCFSEKVRLHDLGCTNSVLVISFQVHLNQRLLSLVTEWHLFFCFLCTENRVHSRYICNPSLLWGTERFPNSLPMKFSPESRLNTRITKAQVPAFYIKHFKSPLAYQHVNKLSTTTMSEDQHEHHRNGAQGNHVATSPQENSQIPSL